MNTLTAYLLSFMIPLLIILMNMCMLGITPFGDKTVLMWDALYQYKDYFGYLWDLLHCNVNVQYAATKSLGGSFPGILGFYLSSPLNVFLYFFKKNSIPLFMSLMVILRISLSGLTCNIYLKKRFSIPLVWGLILSSSYALMEYNVYYCRNCMWLDGVILLPLIALGVWYLLENKGIGLLWVSTGLAIIANWYSAYMVCLMSGFLFIFEYFLKSEFRILDQFRNGGALWIRNYLSAMLGGITAGAIMLIPGCLPLISGKVSNNRTLISSVVNFDFLHFLSGFDISSQVYSTIEPILYCSYFTLVVCIYYFFSHKIGKKKKWATGIFMLFLTCSFCFRQLELLWTAFIESPSFYFRFAFVFAFLMVWTSAFTIMNILEKGIDRGALLKTVIIIIVAAYLLGRKDDLFSKPKILICSLFCILFYAIVLLVADKSKVPGKHIIYTLLSLATLGIVFGELYYNTRLAFAHYDKSEEQFSEYEKEMEELVLYMDARSRDEYYRFEKNDSYLFLNDANVATCESMFYNYHSIEHYSSCYDINVSRFLANVGYSNWMNSKYFLTETYWNSPMVAMEALLSEKYILWNEDTFGYRKVLDRPLAGLEERHLYQNDFKLPLGYNVSTDMGDLVYGPDPFENQNMIYSGFLGKETKIYHDVGLTFQGTNDDQTEEHWILELEKDGPVYLYPDGKKVHVNFASSMDNAEIYVNGRQVQTISKRFLINALYIGDYHAGDQVRVVIKKHNGLDKRYFLYAGQLDTEIFKAAIRFLSQGYHSNLRFEGNKLEGTYTTDRDTTMLLSIPYEKNWTVYVDGKKTEAKMLAGVFTGIDLKAGKHRIRMVYRAAGILPGAILSGLSCLSFFCYIFAVRKIWKRNDVLIFMVMLFSHFILCAGL